MLASNANRNFKFILKSSYDERVLFTHHCGLNDPATSIELLNNLKMIKADILVGFIENSCLYYSQPTDQWRSRADFRKLEKELLYRDDLTVETEQRKQVFVKTTSQILSVQMKCSNLFVASMIQEKPSEEEVIDSSFEEDDAVKEVSKPGVVRTSSLNLKSTIVQDLVRCSFVNWEFIILDVLKIDYSKFIKP